MKRVFKPCRTCNRKCRIVHPHWQQYYAQIAVYTVPEFFLKLGYLPDEHLPPAMITCPTCQGVGEVSALVPVAEHSGLWQQLGIVVYKWMGGAPL